MMQIPAVPIRVLCLSLGLLFLAAGEGAPPGLDARVSLSAEKEPLSKVAARLSEMSRVPIRVEEAVSDRAVTVKAENAPLSEVLASLAPQVPGLRALVFPSGAVRLAARPGLSLSLREAPLSAAIDLIARLSGRNVFLAPGVEGKATLDLRNMDWEEALQKAVEPHGLAVSRRSKDGLFLVEEPLARPFGAGAAGAAGRRLTASLGLSAEAEKRAESARSEGEKAVVRADEETGAKRRALLGLLAEGATDGVAWGIASREHALARAEREKAGAALLAGVAAALPGEARADFLSEADGSAPPPAGFFVRQRLVVPPRAGEPGLTIKKDDCTVSELAGEISRAAGVSVEADPDIGGERVSVDWKGVPLSEALTRLGSEHGSLSVVALPSGAIRIERSNLLSMKFSGAPFPAVVGLVERLSGRKVEYAPLPGAETVTVNVHNVPFDAVLAALADQVGARVVRRGEALALEPAPDAPLSSALAVSRLRPKGGPAGAWLESLRRDWEKKSLDDAVRIRDLRRAVLAAIAEGKPSDESVAALAKARAEREEAVAAFLRRLRKGGGKDAVDLFLGTAKPKEPPPPPPPAESEAEPIE